MSSEQNAAERITVDGRGCDVDDDVSHVNSERDLTTTMTCVFDPSFTQVRLASLLLAGPPQR